MDERVGAPLSEAYTTRSSVLTRETTWRLTPDALVRENHGELLASGWRTIIETVWRVLFPWGGRPDEDAWPTVTPFDQIASIRVRFDPTRFDRKRVRCDIRDAQGRRVSLFSTRYTSFGSFEDQSQAYEPFVAELMRRVMAARPETPIYTGLSWPAYLLQHGLLLIALLALASVLAMAGLPAMGTVWAKMIITLTYAGTLWAYSTRNRPQRVNPPPRR